MSNLLSQASLVMIPSGYKEDVVYSAIPENGNGDLSFTRASNGTRVNSAGLVEDVAWNLFTYSEQFQNADWIGGGNGKPTMTDNFAVAPNGTMTASKMEAASDGYQLRQNVATPNTQMSVSVWLRTNTGTKTIQLFLNNAVTALQNITVTTTWTRYEISGLVTTLAGDGRNGLYTTEALTSGAYILVWGFQTNLGLTAKPYFPTTDRLNVPRLTYQNGGGGCPSLLLEKQSTNLALYSEQFDNAGWTKLNVQVTANATTSPDGTTNADKLIADSGFSSKAIYQGIAPSGVSTATIYAKAGEFGGIAIATGTMGAFFNLVTGTYRTSYVSAPTSYAIESVGNGWYKCSVTFTLASADNFYIGPNDNSSSTFAVTGNGTDGIFLWGCQLEASSYPTSYIPTTSSSATRVADECSKTGISSLIGQTEGVLFADFVYLGQTQSEVIDISDGTEDNRVMCYINSSGLFQIYVTISASTDGFISTSFAPSVGSRYKIAIAYKSNDIAFYVNGTSQGTDTSATIPATSKLTISNGGASNYLLASQFNEAVLFKTRLTNAELASLTTI